MASMTAVQSSHPVSVAYTPGTRKMPLLTQPDTHSPCMPASQSSCDTLPLLFTRNASITSPSMLSSDQSQPKSKAPVMYPQVAYTLKNWH